MSSSKSVATLTPGGAGLARRVAGCVAGLALLLAAPAAAAPAVELGPSGLECGGDPIVPDRVIEGHIPGALQGAYLMMPFEVAEGTTQVRVRYCWEAGHTLDLGLWHAPAKGKEWKPADFRGWGGSSHPDVTITPQGFSSEADYLADPKGHVPGRTTRGFVPGALPPGRWAAELGVGAVLTVEEGDDDGAMAFRLELARSDDPAFAVAPYVPAPYSSAPARSEPGWYTGDMHVHAEHSALGDATMDEVFDFAFRSRDEGGAGLDFVTLSDYVTTSGWDEIGRHQAQYPDRLIIRSSEVITYEGHLNNHASAAYTDHRAGPLYEMKEDGKLKSLRKSRAPKKMLKDIHKAGGWTQLNHVETCPSTEPFCVRTCRGCPWDYSPKKTRFKDVDAIEVASGPAQLFGDTNLFSLAAIAFWEERLAAGDRIAAVGSSDSHRAGRTESGTQSPIGTAATVVHAAELSEQGIADGVRAGHTYVKLFGSGAPDLRFEARASGDDAVAIMGDKIKARDVEFTARVLGVPEGEAFTLHLLKDGELGPGAPVPSGDSEHTFPSSGKGRYRLELRRGAEIHVLTTPIWLAKKS
jgi:hypothetical protein